MSTQTTKWDVFITLKIGLPMNYSMIVATSSYCEYDNVTTDFTLIEILFGVNSL